MGSLGFRELSVEVGIRAIVEQVEGDHVLSFFLFGGWCGWSWVFRIISCFWLFLSRRQQGEGCKFKLNIELCAGIFTFSTNLGKISPPGCAGLEGLAFLRKNVPKDLDAWKTLLVWWTNLWIQQVGKSKRSNNNHHCTDFGMVYS